MPDEASRRLRQEHGLLTDLRQDAPGLWRDDAMRDLHLRHVRPHDAATQALLAGLSGHEVALERARTLARTVVDANDEVIETGQTVNTELAQAARSVKAAHDHSVHAVADDESAKATELQVMRLVQEANLIGFGGTVAS
jgi:hypothetical protein